MSDLNMNEETKKCKYCQSDININAKICPNCRKKQGMKTIEKVAIVIGIILIGSVFLGMSNDKSTNDVSYNSNQVESVPVSSDNVESTDKQEESKVLTLNDTFEFNDFKTTVKSYEVKKINNDFLDTDKIVVFDVTLKNMSDKSKSIYGIKVYDGKGIEVEDCSIWLDEYEFNTFSSIRANATLDYQLVYEFNGNGEYVIEFDNWLETKEVFIDVVE